MTVPYLDIFLTSPLGLCYILDLALAQVQLGVHLVYVQLSLGAGLRFSITPSVRNTKIFDYADEQVSAILPIGSLAMIPDLLAVSSRALILKSLIPRPLRTNSPHLH